MSYNGWANYETWNVMLWLNNDEGLYYSKQDYLDECSNNGETPRYVDLIGYLGFEDGDKTPDDVEWFSYDLALDELDAALEEEMEGD